MLSYSTDTMMPGIWRRLCTRSTGAKFDVDDCVILFDCETFSRVWIAGRGAINVVSCRSSSTSSSSSSSGSTETADAYLLWLVLVGSQWPGKLTLNAVNLTCLVTPYHDGYASSHVSYWIAFATDQEGPD